MGSLTVEDPEAHRLAHAISRATGESISRIVTDALRERYAAVEREAPPATVEELLAIADSVAAMAKGVVPDHGELLYDSDGLPK
jgi:antitoxin VapB